MRGFDAFAGVIKSGGKTRRAAKMVILNIDHPDVEEFIWCKAKEEKKAWTLIDAGYDGSFDGEAYKSVFFQNSNNSVRVTDDFMEAVQKDRDWSTARGARRQPVETFKARELWREIAEAAWECGDPGLQFDTTVNAWHTSPNTARINASQPVLRVHVPRRLGLQPGVAEPAQVPDAQRRRVRRRGVQARGRDRPSSAQEIIVGNARYPTERIERQLAPLPAAGPGLRQPRRAADVAAACPTTRAGGAGLRAARSPRS